MSWKAPKTEKSPRESEGFSFGYCVLEQAQDALRSL